MKMRTQNNFDWLRGCYNRIKRRHDSMKRVLREIAREHPNYEAAGSAFYRVRQKAKEALLKGLILVVMFCFLGCASRPETYPVVPDYRNGKPNALVCPDNGDCFQCDHATAKRYAKLWAECKWDGGIVFLPLNKKP